jgi:hypothetical protein
VAFLGEGFHPAAVIVGPLTQDFFADGADLDVREKVDDVLGAAEQGQMTEDDDTVETVVYEECYVQHSSYNVNLSAMWS